MELTRNYASFRIEVRPSPETNDHEVRLFGDDVDLIASLDDDMMGMDPDDILGATNPLQANGKSQTAVIARCGCGHAGCGRCEVQVGRNGDVVEWRYAATLDRTIVISFPSALYDRELDRARADHTWETPDRTAARIFSSSPQADALARQGFSLLWASGRIRAATFTVSMTLVPGPYQVLVHIPWNGEAPDTIATRARQLLATPASSWPDVEWFAQVPNLSQPHTLGPGWRHQG